jgi:flagellar motility protein MotE (MotC chaperone)
VTNIFRRLRLLPAVFVLGGALLLLKGTDVTLEARAETAAAATPSPSPAPADATAPAADPAADDTQASSIGEVDVLTSLAKRRTELDAREQALGMRENLIAAAEQRVDGKITQLKLLQSQVQVLLGNRDDAEQKQLAALVKTYSSMKPKDAARIFNNLDEDVLLSVAAQMKPDVLGAVLAGMQPDQAQKLTVKLANRLKIPATPPPAPPQQLAATTPPPTTAPMVTPPATPTATAPPIATPAASSTNTPPPAAAPPANNTAAPAKK